MKKKISVNSYGKINLSLDVTGVLPSGMHEVDMIMQQISMHDDVVISIDDELIEKSEPARAKDEKYKGENLKVLIKVDKPYVPTDERNLAYRAAMLIYRERLKKDDKGKDGTVVNIDITKRIPVSGGMAGGSGNAAAVLHGLNILWDLKLSLEEVQNIGAKLGSDIPFCILGQAHNNSNIGKYYGKKARNLSPCYRGRGTGTTLTPVAPLKKALLICRPKAIVSTAEVYGAIDSCNITLRPDTEELVKGLHKRKEDEIYNNMINVLEAYTLNAYPNVKEAKSIMEKELKARKVLMSGSGPTLFGVYDNLSEAKKDKEALRKMGYMAFWSLCSR